MLISDGYFYETSSVNMLHMLQPKGYGLHAILNELGYMSISIKNQGIVLYYRDKRFQI